MKVLFIHTFNYYEPLGIMYLSAFLKKHGHFCELLDLKFQKYYIEEAKKINPDIIAYSVTTNNWKKYQQINLNLKKHLKFFAVFGGPHCTFYPDFIQEDGVDAICRGEGEYPMLELVEKIANNQDITKTQNFWIKKDNIIYKNDLRPLIEDLDLLPFPDREIINKYKHYEKRSRIRTITSRGCLFKCSYCFNHANQKIYKGKGTYIRHRSPENVIRELKILKEKYKPGNIEFHDDIFILDVNWLKRFSKLFLEENINIPFEINIRLDLLTPEIVEILDKTGCYSVQYGIESGNELIRKQLLKRNITNKEIIEKSKLLQNASFKINTYNMIGYPGESIENAFETLFLNIKCKPNYAMNTIYYPYPMNELTEYSEMMGFYNEKHDGNRKNLFYGDIVISTPLKRKFFRLHYLFGFGVKMPCLVKLIKLLIKLPFGYLYQFLFFLYRSYAIFIIFRRLTIKEIFIREKHKKKEF